MTTLYIEPFGGMAGDMLLAALLDLDDPRFTRADLGELASALVPGECSVAVERARRGPIAATRVAVRTAESAHAPHRHLADLERIVAASPLGREAKARATAVLRRIAAAEARVHGIAVEHVHFHEVGAVDTLVDVCGAVFALEKLAIERVFTSPPLTGTGAVDCAHGELPVPPPAVAEILRGLPARVEGAGGERLTPTGAALLAELARFEPPGAFVCERIGYGAGAKDPEEGPPNVVRVQLGRSADPAPAAAGGARRAAVLELAVNVDDMTGEEIAHALDALRAAGALDAWATPVQMKKGRPGIVLSALCRPEARAALERAVFETTPTLGLRWLALERTECGRRTIEVYVAGRKVRVKLRERPRYEGASPPGERDLSPEHEDVAALAQALGVTLREAERRAIAAALEFLDA